MKKEEFENWLVAVGKKIEAQEPSKVIIGLYLIKSMLKEALLKGAVQDFLKYKIGLHDLRRIAR